MKRVSMEMGALIAELQRAQHDLELAADSGSLQSQQPLVRVLKIELLNQMKTVGEHMRQLRWLIAQMLTKESDNSPSQTSMLSGAMAGASLVEQVDAMVTVALGDNPLLRP